MRRDPVRRRAAEEILRVLRRAVAEQGHEAGAPVIVGVADESLDREVGVATAIEFVVDRFERRHQDVQPLALPLIDQRLDRREERFGRDQEIVAGDVVLEPAPRDRAVVVAGRIFRLAEHHVGTPPDRGRVLEAKAPQRADLLGAGSGELGRGQGIGHVPGAKERRVVEDRGEDLERTRSVRAVAVEVVAERLEAPPVGEVEPVEHRAGAVVHGGIGRRVVVLADQAEVIREAFGER